MAARKVADANIIGGRMNPLSATRRRTAVALLVATLVGLGPMAFARAVTRSDVALAEEAVAQAAGLLAQARQALDEAEQTEARLVSTIARLRAQQVETAAATVTQETAVRDRIARMYMVAGGAGSVVVADVASFSTRVAYLGAISESDRATLNRFALSSRQIAELLTAAESRLDEQQARIVELAAEQTLRTTHWEEAQARLDAVEAEWDRQEAARIAAEEAELRRQEAELAAQVAAATTTTTRPTGTTTTTTRPDYGYVPGAGVEQWRPIVAEVFADWGLDQTKCATRNGIEFCVGPQIDNALKVMRCESNGIPFAENPRSGAAGLFQNLPYYWQSRVDRVRAYHSDKSSIPANASIWNPEHNTIVAALLVWESREALLGNRGGAGVSPAVWPEFNWERYETSGYGYSGWGKGPNPWGHWTCGAHTGVYLLSWVHPWATQQTPPE